MVADVLALIVILKEALELAEATLEVMDLINSVIDLLGGLEEPSYAELTLEQKTLVLRRCTKIIANLDLNLSCYPLGYATTLLFDLDGNPIP